MPQEESKDAIAARLKATRLALGFDRQSQFAKALGSEVTAQRWNNYESGRDRLTLNVALIICRKFPQVTLDWLFRGDRSTLRPAFSVVIDVEEARIKRMRR